MEEDEEIAEFDVKQLKGMIITYAIIKIVFLFMFMGSVFIFPYEIIVDHSFGLGKAFLLVFWGGACLFFGLGAGEHQHKLRKRIKELQSNSSEGDDSGASNGQDTWTKQTTMAKKVSEKDSSD